jgi:hypothetical protein
MYLQDCMNNFISNFGVMYYIHGREQKTTNVGIHTRIFT